MKPIAHLPYAAIELLLVYKLDHPDKFDAYVLGLRKAGWPLRSIAEPFEVTRVTAKNWETRAITRGVEPTADETVPAMPLDVRGMRVRAKRIPPDVPTADRARIAELSEQARKVRRWTLEGSAERKAADELHNLIYKYVIERKVPAAVFARYAGVSRRAIMQRVERIKDDTITS